MAKTKAATPARATAARNAIGPLLDRLILQLDCEGSMTQRAHFARIRRSLELARSEWDLARSLLAISTTTAVGFRFSHDADALISRILQKLEQFESGDEQPPRIH